MQQRFLEYEQSAVFPLKLFPVRTGILLTISHGTVTQDIARSSSVSKSLCEITYNCGEPLLGEAGTHQIEIPGGSSALGLLKQGTHGYAEYKEAHRVSFCSLWMTKENLIDFLYKIHPSRTGLLPLQGDRDCGYQACRMDAREDCIIHKLIHGLVPGQDCSLNALMIESHVLELVSLKL